MILARYLPVTITEQPMTINQDLKALRVREHVEVSYLANFLRSKSSTIIALADTAAHGTRVLRSEDWMNLPVPVPPKGEQIAIIARAVSDLVKAQASTMRKRKCPTR
jgi:type I restriction enzyme S subunit